MIPNNNLGYPLRICCENQNLGSGFLLRMKNNDVYLVSAAHVLIDPNTLKPRNESIIVNGANYLINQKNVDQIQIDLSVIQKKKQYFLNPRLDIIAIKIGKVILHLNEEVLKFENCTLITKCNVVALTPVSENTNIKKFSELNVAMNLLQYGFPTSIGIESNIIQHDIPLVRKGSIAALYYKNKTIIADCEAIYGNSGGPICIEIPNYNGVTEFYVVGIVLSFVEYTEVFINPRNKLEHKHVLNSGYSNVRSIDDILDLINGNTPNTNLS